MRIYALQERDGEQTRLSVILNRTLKPHSSPVVVATTDRTGTLLATGGADSIIKIWDIRGGFVTHTFRGHGGLVTALRFFEGPQGLRGKTKTSNKKSREGMQQSTESGPDSGSSFYLASGSEDSRVRVWDLEKRTSIANLDSHVSVVRGIDYAEDLKLLVSVSRDKTLIIWDIHTWKPRRVIPVFEGLEAVNVLPNSNFLVSGGEHGRLRVWNPVNGQELTREQPAGSEIDAIVQVIPIPNQDLLLSVHADQSLLLHSTDILQGGSDLESQIDPLPITQRISGTHDEIIDAVYVTRDRSLLALATNTEHVRLVSLAQSPTAEAAADASRYFGSDVALLSGHEDIIICLATDWSGQWLATGAKDNTARIWRIDHTNGVYEHYATCTGHAESIGAIAFPNTQPPNDSAAYSSPFDHPPRFLLTGSQDKTIKQWSVPKSSNTPGRSVYTRKAHEKDINSLAISPTAHLFASASQDRTVKIWSIEEGETQGVLRGHKRGVWSVAFAPKDTPTLAGDGGSTSTSRGLVLTGSGDRTVKIWSLNDFSCLRTFEGHTNSVLKVLWLPCKDTDPTKRQDPQVASAGGDGLVKIWDAASGECLTTLDNHTDRIWALTVDPTTRTLVSGGGDSIVTFWRDTTIETQASRDQAATERVEQDQDLANRIHRKQYREAITLALALDHPARLLSLFQAVLATDPPEPGSLTGVSSVDEVLSSLSDEQLLLLLKRVRDWNTNARTCNVAQRVLNVVVRAYPATRLAKLGKMKGGRQIVDALKAYTERHFQRLDELWGESWLVEFLLGQMGGLVVDDRDQHQDLDGDGDVARVLGDVQASKGLESLEGDEDTIMV